MTKLTLLKASVDEETENVKQLTLIITSINSHFKKDIHVPVRFKVQMFEKLDYLTLYLTVNRIQFIELLSNEIGNMLLDKELLNYPNLKEHLTGIALYLQSKLGGSNEKYLH